MSASVAGPVLGIPWGGTPPHAPLALLNAHVTVGHSDSTPSRLGLPSVAGGSCRRPGICLSGWSHRGGSTCLTWGAGAARAVPVTSGQRSAEKRAHHRLRAWPQLSAELRMREPRGGPHLQGSSAARVAALTLPAMAGAARQFEGAEPRLGARARTWAPARLRRPVHKPPRRSQFGGNASCLGRRRRHGRLRLGGRRGTWRRPRAVGLPGSSQTSARPPRPGPAPELHRTTFILASRRPTAWRRSAAGWPYARRLWISLLVTSQLGRLKQVAKGQLKTVKFTSEEEKGETVAAPQQLAVVVEGDLGLASCAGATRLEGGPPTRPRPQPVTLLGTTSPLQGLTSAGC